MWIGESFVQGSIGGGHMENEVITRARHLLRTNDQSAQLEFTLGPDSGQCCGGVVNILISKELLRTKPAQILAIFGAGHVGANLKRLAEAVGFDVRLFDDRSHVEIERAEPYDAIAIPEIAISQLPLEASVVILTHDHGLDFLLAEAALGRGFPYIGMIGSKSKAARFRQNHPHLDFENFHSPIAKHSNDKRPEAIALSILSDVMAHDHQRLSFDLCQAK